MADTYTIAAAARLCGCPRSTIQRAIRRGRLHLDPNHQLDPDELTRAGYLTTATQQEHAAGAQQERATLEGVLRDMQRLMERVTQLLEILTQTPQDMQQERSMQRPPTTRQPRSLERSRLPTAGRQGDTHAPRYDPTRYFLGVLCPRGHDYGGTGQSLRQRANRSCRRCDIEQKRARRQREREQRAGGQ